MASDEATVPADHRRWLRDQQDARLATAVHGCRQNSQDCAVGFCEARPGNLTLQNEDLATQNQDSALRVSPVANTHRKRVNTRRAKTGNRVTSAERYPAALRPASQGTEVQRSVRHPHVRRMCKWIANGVSEGTTDTSPLS